MVNVGLLAAESVSLVCGTQANFNGFRVLAALLHGTLAVGVSQTAALTEGVTYIRQGGHQAGHWPTFLVTRCTQCRTVVFAVVVGVLRRILITVCTLTISQSGTC